MKNIIQKMKDFQETMERSGANASTETFMCGLLNLVFGYRLSNVQSMNYPGVDLIDPEKRVAVQITTDSSTMKLRATIGSFIDNELYKQFSELLVIQLTGIQAPQYRRYIVPGDGSGGEWNYQIRTYCIPQLVGMIDNLTPEAQKKISDYLDTVLGTLPPKAAPSGEERLPDPIPPVERKDIPFVFISYSHLDYERVQGIVEAMGKKGMYVWWDQDIEPGAPWDETIGNRLFDCKCVVALVTRNFMESSACMDEIYVGKEKDKLLMVYLDELEFPPKMYRYMRIQALHFPKGTTDDKICERLSKTELLKDCYIQ